MEEMDLGRGVSWKPNSTSLTPTPNSAANTLSCTPYDRGKGLEEGIALRAESNAVCFHSWTKWTNREWGFGFGHGPGRFAPH